MATIWIAGLFVLFAWWFSTGAILWVVGRAERGGARAYRHAVVLALPVLVLGVIGIHRSAPDPSVGGAYLAFAGALAVWGWFELAFLAGVITGPVTTPCPPGLRGPERFLRAWGTIAYSEMALIACLLGIAALSWDAPNQIGLWTFVLLFAARLTAKLNVYLGVPNINDHFLPTPVRHLATHFRRTPMNAFFPWSVTFLTFATACWVERLIAAPAGSGAEIGFALLATLTALALFEHWMMVLPLRDAALWTWALSGDKPRTPRDVAAAVVPRHQEALVPAHRRET